MFIKFIFICFPCMPPENTEFQPRRKRIRRLSWWCLVKLATLRCLLHPNLASPADSWKVTIEIANWFSHLRIQQSNYGVCTCLLTLQTRSSPAATETLTNDAVEVGWHAISVDFVECDFKKPFWRQIDCKRQYQMFCTADVRITITTLVCTPSESYNLSPR